jgi:hypothetical protein
MTEPRFKVVPNHIYGPAVIDTQTGALVDNGPLAFVELISDALNAAVTEDVSYAVDAFLALRNVDWIVTDRVLRALSRMVQRLEADR